MPLPELPQLPSEEDDDSYDAGRNSCLRYLRWVRALLEHLIHDNEFAGLFDDGLRQLAQQAWPSVVQQVDAIVQRPGDMAEGAVLGHGLFGPQLRFKLAVVRHWLDKFQAGDASLSQLLIRVDDVLKSILDLIGGGGALDEFKKGVEGSTDE